MKRIGGCKPNLAILNINTVVKLGLVYLLNGHAEELRSCSTIRTCRMSLVTSR